MRVELLRTAAVVLRNRELLCVLLALHSVRGLQIICRVAG